MKLGNRISRNNIFLSTLVLMVGGYIIYYLLVVMVGTQTDYELKYQLEKLGEQITAGLNWEVLAQSHDVSIDTISPDSVKYREPHLDYVKIELTRRNRERENTLGPLFDLFGPGASPHKRHHPPPHGKNHKRGPDHKGKKRLPPKGQGPIKPEVRRATQDLQVRGTWYRIRYFRKVPS